MIGSDIGVGVPGGGGVVGTAGGTGCAAALSGIPVGAAGGYAAAASTGAEADDGYPVPAIPIAAVGGTAG
jgi:hypothetical protein